MVRIICAGAPKTGTTSVCAALRDLGYNVYDSAEQVTLLLQEWERVLLWGAEPNWRSMFAGVDAVTDGPGFYFWEQLLAAYPEAKVILLTRNEDEWAESYRRQKEVENGFRWLAWLSADLRRVFAVADASEKLSMGSEVFSPYLYKWKLQLHNERVREKVPRAQLLELDVREGWRPLCKFLGKEVPAHDFPRCNQRVEDQRKELRGMAVAVIGSLCLKVLAAGVAAGAVAAMATAFVAKKGCGPRG